MADELTPPPWREEQIPGEHLVYMRVHENDVDAERRPKEAAFRLRPNVGRPNLPPGMSTDWSKYATPTETRGRGGRPEQNGVVSLSVSEVRALQDQDVVHTPSWLQEGVCTSGDNRAHADVTGPKKPQDVPSSDHEARHRTQFVKTRYLLRKICDWEILPESPVTERSSE